MPHWHPACTSSPPLLAFCLLALQWDRECERKAPGELELGMPGRAEPPVLREGARMWHSWVLCDTGFLVGSV